LFGRRTDRAVRRAEAREKLAVIPVPFLIWVKNSRTTGVRGSGVE
jgi:hypothetical protein